MRAGPGGIASQPSLAIDAWLNATVVIAIAATHTRIHCTIILLHGRWIGRAWLRVQDTSHKSRALDDLRKLGELDREGVFLGASTPSLSMAPDSAIGAQIECHHRASPGIEAS